MLYVFRFSTGFPTPPRHIQGRRAGSRRSRAGAFQKFETGEPQGKKHVRLQGGKPVKACPGQRPEPETGGRGRPSPPGKAAPGPVAGCSLFFRPATAPGHQQSGRGQDEEAVTTKSPRRKRGLGHLAGPGGNSRYWPNGWPARKHPTRGRANSPMPVTKRTSHVVFEAIASAALPYLSGGWS